MRKIGSMYGRGRSNDLLKVKVRNLNCSYYPSCSLHITLGYSQ